MATKPTDPNNPETYGINLATAMVIASFCTIAWVNTIELQFRIWLGFKRYTGLYFWALVVSSWGCTFHPLGFLFLDFGIIRQANAVGVIIGISWWCMVTGQALVLYSRLHLVVRDKRKIRWVLVMIITNFCILHLPIMVLSQCAYSPIPNAAKWLSVYNVYEKVQMTGFTCQELIISGLYLWETRKILRPGRIFQKEKTRKVFFHLIWVNIFIITLDIALLSTEYANLFSIQTVFKAAVYSVKLRFEFVVLNQLMDLSSGRSSAFDQSADRHTGASNPNTYASDGPRSTHHQLRLNSISGDRSGPQSPNINTYSVSASKGLDKNQVDESKIDGVLRTTEVHVTHGTPKSPRDQAQSETSPELYTSNRHGEANTGRSKARSPSPDSEEINFAVNGADLS